MERTVLRCPRCGADLPDDEGHRRLVVVRCAGCKSLVDVPGHSEALARPTYAVPWGFQVDDRGHGGLAVSWRWHRGMQGVRTAFFGTWGTGAALMAATFTFLSLVEKHGARWSALLATLPFFSIGIAMVTYALSTVLNRARIEVTRAGLRIDHGPLRWRGSIELSREDTTDVYVSEVSGGWAESFAGVRVFALCVKGRTGTVQELLRSNQIGIQGELELRWLAQEIRRQFGME